MITEARRPSALDVQISLGKAADRVRDWVDGRLDDDALRIARLYKSSRDRLLARLRAVYEGFLRDDPTIVRARRTGALSMIDLSVDATVRELTEYLGQSATHAVSTLLADQPALLRRELKFVPFEALEMPTQRVMDELTTRVVGGGTFFDHLFNVTDRLKSDITRTTRTALLNSYDFDTMRRQMLHAFGVDRLAEPKSNAYGAVKVYKNEARRQWNLLMKKTGRDAQQIWWALLDEDTTPGCAARHGYPLVGDDTPPRHYNCRCTVAVFPPGEDLSVFRAQGSAWLAQHHLSRRAARAQESGWSWGVDRLMPIARIVEPRESIAYTYRTVAWWMLPHMLLYPLDGTWSRELEPVLYAANSDHVLLRRTTYETQVRAWSGWRALKPRRSERLIETARGFAVDSTDRIQWDETRYVRAAVACFEDDGRVWAIRPRGTYVWTLPGGGLKEGEAIRDAAVREMLEETGLRVTIQRRLGLIDRTTSVTAVFLAERVGAPEDVKTPEEIDACAALSVSELVEDERTFLSRFVEASFDPAEHPRGKPGTPQGGQFVPKGAGALGEVAPETMEWAGGSDGFVDETTYRVYHGTTSDRAAQIRQSGLRAPESMRGSARWFMVTTNKDEAANFATGYAGTPVVLEFRVPASQLKKLLWKGQRTSSGDIQHAIRGDQLDAQYIVAQHTREAVRAFKRYPKGSPKGGEFAPTGAAAASREKIRGEVADALRAKPTSADVSVRTITEKVFTGQSEPKSGKLSKSETGYLAEQIVLGYLHSQGFKDARTLNRTRNNFPLDFIHDHEVIEVKGGLLSNTPRARQWRLTIGQPGKEESAWLTGAVAEHKADWNGDKRSAIVRRKQAVLDEVNAVARRKFKVRTITTIINVRGQKADLYSFDGLHTRIGWKSKGVEDHYTASVSFKPRARR